jgi:alpha-L-rhamnosidase
MGWTGDAQVFARTATYNMNVDPFYTRWLYSVRDNQGDDGSYANYIPVVGFPPHGAEDGGGAMGWMEAGVIVPWQMYQQYGDVRILEQHYASMVAYMDYLMNLEENTSTQLVDTRPISRWREFGLQKGVLRI